MKELEYVLYEIVDDTDHPELRSHSRIYFNVDDNFIVPQADDIMHAVEHHPIPLRAGKYRLFPAGSEIDITVKHETEVHD
jgi:hypothetical protein